MTVQKKPRRKRCSECNRLKPRGEGSMLSGKWVCADCLPVVAEREAPVAVPNPNDEVPDGSQVELMDVPPSQVASLLDEAAAAGLSLTLGEKAAATIRATGVAEPVAVLERPRIPSLASKEERIERARSVPEASVPGWPMAKGRLSASAIGSFLTCPERFRQSYIKGRWGPSSPKQIAGRAIHEALDVAMRFKVQSGLDLSVDEAADVAADAYEASIDEAREIEWGDESRGDWKDKTNRVVQTWAEHVGPTLHPVASEQSFAYSVPGCPVPVVGYIDLVTESSLVDYKVGKAYSKIQPDWRLQGLLYLRAMPNHNPLPMTWHSLSWPLKDGSVSYHTPMDAGSAMVLPNTAANYETAGAIVVNVAEAIMAYAERFGLDDPWPGQITHTYACSFCDFHPDRAGGCRWWQQAAASPFD